ncbi:MAG TPA: Tol-Pal system beta propeller repeat protein TolB [Thermoanaerobaculia bacterium]|nr:Tol-Pal system beta propeller repeat protein TolB [Thermoanaerobaculia bacterium]
MRPKAASYALASCLLLLGVALTAAQPPAPAPQDPQAPPQQPLEQQPEVTLELNRGQRALMKVAFPSFRGSGQFVGESARAARELEDTVRQDLEVSGYFDLRGPDQLRGIAVTGNLQQDVAAYHAAGNEILILGDVREEGNRLVFEGRVFDLGSGQAILAKRYRGSFDSSRRIGHTFADEVIRFLIGKPGIALSSIAYTSERGGAKEIWVMDYDGENPRRITGHRSTSMSPAWGPGGGAIAYVSFFNGPPGIYLADIGSGQKRPVVTSGSLNTSPSFSPDGGRIAFARSVDGNIEIFSVDRDGGGLRRLTNSNAIDTNPAWSPKGSSIAFTSSRAGNPHLYLMDPEGSNQRRLTFDGTYNDGASWSPDGDLVAYASRREGRFQIAVTNVGTLATRVLTSGPGENESPTFSPDGRKIAFTSRRAGGKQIWVMDVDGSNLRQLTREGSNDMADWSRLTPEK